MKDNSPIEYLGSFAICFATGVLVVQLWNWAIARSQRSPEYPRTLETEEKSS